MTPLSRLTIALASVPDVDAALRLINEELEDDKLMGVVLLAVDGRRGVIVDRAAGSALPPHGSGTGRVQVALDYLPAPARAVLLDGRRFAQVGEQGMQYARLLGITLPGDDVRLWIKGIVLDGTLTAVVAAYDGRRRGAGRLPEQMEPLVALFELAYARFYERDARFEAVATLHEVTARLRAEHTAAQVELEREITRLREARGDVIDRKRVEQLQAAAENARHRAATAEQRLAAVEQQVTSAVARLEQAHVQLHRQAETIRVQGETIRELEARLGLHHPDPAQQRRITPTTTP